MKKQEKSGTVRTIVPASQSDTRVQTHPRRRNWEETEMIALQEKARRYPRQYRMGGYQGL